MADQKTGSLTDEDIRRLRDALAESPPTPTSPLTKTEVAKVRDLLTAVDAVKGVEQQKKSLLRKIWEF